MPTDVQVSSRDSITRPVYNVPAQAGDLIFVRNPRLLSSALLLRKSHSPPGGAALQFSEATIHGTLPWTNPDTERRSLMYRFMPKYLHFAGGTFETSQPGTNESAALLSASAKSLNEPAVFQTGCRI